MLKKVVRIILMVAMLLTVFALPALAEGAAAVAQAYDWASLGTIAGATAATLIIVQLIKAPLDKVWKLPTRLVVYLIALGLMMTAQAFTDGLTWESGVLAAVNAAMVALSSYGAYELTFHKVDPGGNVSQG